MTPRVSVVVCHYDRAAWLPEALASVRAQTFDAYEIVLVDDGGPAPEVTARTAAAFGARHVRRETNGGIAAARNTGVRAAQGDLVAWLDDDDLWLPHHLASLVALLDAQPAAQLAYADAEVRRLAPPAAAPAPGNPAPGSSAPGSSAHGGPTGTAPATWPLRARLTLAVPFDRADLARDDFIVPGAMLHRRALYERVGPFDETLHVSDDWDWLLRAHTALGDAAFVRRPAVGVIVRIVERATVNLSYDFGPRRLAALAELERRHGTPKLEPKTFWEVAETYARRARRS